MMKKSADSLIRVSVIAAFVFFAFSCDTSTELNDVVGPECAENHATALENIYFYFRAAGGDSFVPIAKPMKLKIGEDLKLLITFNDEDCNLANGDLYYQFDEEEFNGALPDKETDMSGIGCDDENGSGPITLTLVSSRMPDTTGNHQISVMVRDQCGEYSNVLTEDLRIVED